MRLQYCVFRSQRSASDYYPPGITIGRLSGMHGIAGFRAALVLAGTLVERRRIDANLLLK